MPNSLPLRGCAPVWIASALLWAAATPASGGPSDPQPTGERLVHRYLAVELSRDGSRVASVEGDSPAGGFSPRIRDLVIRSVRDGAALTVALPCGRVPECWPDEPAWAADGKQLSFVLRTPGSHARTL